MGHMVGHMVGHVVEQGIADIAGSADASRRLWVSGLAFEARIAMRAGGATPNATLYGVRGESLSAALRERLHLPGDREPMVVSFGVAGGLDPALPPGTIVIAEAVLTDRQRYPTDAGWRAALLQALPSATVGTLLGADAPILDVAGKRQRHLAGGALAVDMESHRVAQVAAEVGAPCLVCRVIADPATRAVPEAALAAMGPAGEIALGAMLRGLLRHPAQAVALSRLAGDAALARGALRRAARALGRCDGVGLG